MKPTKEELERMEEITKRINYDFIECEECFSKDVKMLYCPLYDKNGPLLYAFQCNSCGKKFGMTEDAFLHLADENFRRKVDEWHIKEYGHPAV